MQTQRDTIPQPQSPTTSIGTKIPLVPHHVTKILYRQGQGPCAKPGQSVNCYYHCYLIDGKEMIRKKNVVRRLPVGTGRLVRGLEIVLKTARRGEKFTVIVSPEYAYRDVEVSENVPKREKLVFDFQIVSIQMVPFAEKTEVQMLFDLALIFRKIDQQIKQKKYDQALTQIQHTTYKIASTKYHKNDLYVSLSLKQTLILCQQNKHSQALTLALKSLPLQPSNHKLMLAIAKLHTMFGQMDKAKYMLTKCHDMHPENYEVKKHYVEFLKEMKDYAALRMLAGYNIMYDEIVLSCGAGQKVVGYRFQV